MSNCPHCGYSDPGAWQECPSCGQFAGPTAAGPAPPPYAAMSGDNPYAATSGDNPHGAAPGDNPYAAPAVTSAPPAAYGYAYAPPSMLPTSGKAIASLVIGICSIVLYFLGFILGPLAIGLWASARNDFKQMPPLYKGQGLATAGLVTGLIGTLIGLLMVAFIILAIVMASQNPRHY